MMDTTRFYDCGCYPEEDRYCLEAAWHTEEDRKMSFFATTTLDLTASERWTLRQEAKKARRWVVRHLQEQENAGLYKDLSSIPPHLEFEVDPT